MPRSKSVPSYRLHKPTSQAVVTVRNPDGSRRDVYLGIHNSPESFHRYSQILAELAKEKLAKAQAQDSGFTAPDPTLTIDQVIQAYWDYANRHYRDSEGKPTTEVKEIRFSLKPLRDLYAETPASRFGPRRMEEVQERMIQLGWCRTLINRRMERIRRMFKWAARRQLIETNVYAGVKTVDGLQKGRTQVRESKPVKPVHPAQVAATLPRLNRHVRTMVYLQQLTGMRPGEVCALTLEQIERTGDLWIYRPVRHKTAHRGKSRVIPFGPRARTALMNFLVGNHPPPGGFESIELADLAARLAAATAYEAAGRIRDAKALRDLDRPIISIAGCFIDPRETVFSPHWEREERFQSMRANRKFKVQPSQITRRKAKPKRLPGMSYHSHAYATAIAKVTSKAGLPHWHPNQLRHLFATEVRRLHGLEAAQVLLGHAQANVTEVYAERNLALASKVAAAIG